MIARLRQSMPARSTKDLQDASPSISPRPWPRFRVKIKWQPVGPVMVKAGVDGLRVDMLPLLGGVDGQRTPLIPGSSLKGVLRSHAERILRTVLRRNTPPDWHNKPLGRQRFLGQLDEDLPLLQELFGSRGQRDGKRGQGALAVADCFADHPAPTAAWNRMFFDATTGNEVEQQRGFDATKAATRRTKWQKSTHVAIDRWTGGSAEHMLYSVLEPLGETWPEFELELDIDRIGCQLDQRDADKTRAQAWVLLLLTLRDLASNRIPIGFGGNRGLGEVKVDQISIEPLGGSVLGVTSTILLPAGDISKLDPALKKSWQAEWESCLPPIESVPATASETQHD